jgi:hypothetical protein
VAADELSDYQDRVMNEAYLLTARKRVSLARHARLMDYHIHQGNQASTWLALKVNQTLDLPKRKQGKAIQLTVWAGGHNQSEPSDTVFMSRLTVEPILRMHPLLNQMGLYTWSDAIPALAAGSTSADLQLLQEDATSSGTYSRITDETSAKRAQQFIRENVPYLLIQEWLNPATGRAAGRNPDKQQRLKLLPGEARAEAIPDPITGEWFVRVHWDQRNALKTNYCFTINCQEGKKENVSLFHGNLLPVYHGRPASAVFKDAKENLNAPNEFHYERTKKWGTICRLPSEPLAYKDTPVGGEIPPQSTLELEVTDKWDEVISLVHSDNSAEGGDHFIVETDEEGRSLIRFGNGTNGRKLPEGAEVRCTYQVGWGLDGNIGADQLRYFDSTDYPTDYPEIVECWNPFDVNNGRAPEPREEIIRRVPEAYRFRQLRAIALQDYVDRAEELEEVSRAAARYAWTGSWRTVQITIDPVGTGELTPQLRQKVARHLEAVRLIGEDLEIRPPRFVPLEIEVELCIHPDYWPEDVRFFLQQEFSEGYTLDGRLAFFHPDRWTFGQKLRASQIIGRAQLIQGVAHVIAVTMNRWNEGTPGTTEIADVRPNEILRVRNDPNHMEEGFITFKIGGGRQ